MRHIRQNFIEETLCGNEPMCPECCLRVIGDLQTAARNKQLEAE